MKGGSNMKINKKIIAIVMIVLVLCSTSCVFAATNPTLVTKLNSALKKILGYLETLSTPAAGVAIATGVMIRKLSFGDEEKMVIGKRVIINSIVGYLIIQLIDLIIKFIEGIV